MTRIVMKFGATSMADTANLQICATRIAEAAAKGHEIAVVVSAPAGMTNALQERIADITPKGTQSEEADLVLSSGEQINAGLLALELKERGLSARSWTGWQAGIITEAKPGRARIIRAETQKLVQSLQGGNIAILTGFQGVDEQGRITTLGRGGSDVSAVALAAAIQATRCDIYTDVQGVYSADPGMVERARRIDHLTPELALEMASSGARVLHSRSVELALSEHMPIRVLSTFVPGPGTKIEQIPPEQQMETHLVSGVT
jgi:aspartate kinase